MPKQNKTKTKTNKWVEEIIEDEAQRRCFSSRTACVFWDGWGSGEKEKWLKIVREDFMVEDFLNLITQTQQETLEWVLKEVVGEEKMIYVGKFGIESHTERVIGERANNKLIAKQRQTIKQRMEETCSTHVPYIEQCYTSKKDNK